MNKRNKILIGSVASIAVVFSVATYIVGGMVYDGSAGAKPTVAKADMETYYSKNEDKPAEKLKKYKHEKLFVKSEKNGYDIEVMDIKANKESKDVIVLVHGIKRNYYDVLNSAFNYLDNGYNVVVYNQRQTGYTGGNDYTFGLDERYDLDSVVNYASGAYKGGLLGVHGFSMGASTATMHSELNENNKKVKFYILDAPYDTMEGAIDLGIIEEDIPFLPVEYACFAGNLMTKLKSGFTYDEIEPYKAVENITTPVMLIHGTNDKKTDPEGSERIYNSIPHDKKELWLINGFDHCEADDKIPDEYFNRIYTFIDKVVRK